jgi:hypothetical protein
MQSKNLFLTAALSLVLIHTSFGQGPVGDEVMVTFDRAVQVGSQTLPAGKYTIRQVTSASNPRVLEFTSDNGTKLNATIAAAPVLQNAPPDKTKVVVDDEGGQARLVRIWVQGKSYGYEFPGSQVPGSSASSAVALEGRFTSQAAPAAETVTAQERAPAQAPAPISQPAPTDNTVIAQNRPTEAPAPVPAPEPQRTQTPAAQDSSLSSNVPAADAPETDSPQSVPATALGWMQLMALGLVMASVGIYLYWRDRASS